MRDETRPPAAGIPLRVTEWEHIGTAVPPGHRTFTDDEAVPLVTYEYAVAAVNLVGAGAKSESATATAPNPL